MSKGNAVMRRVTAMGVVVLSLCGCGGAGARPRAEPTSSMQTSGLTPRSASPSPSPTRTGPLTTGPGVLPGEKPPVEPSEALKSTQDGAYAFAIYFVKIVDWSIATTDPTLIPELSEPTCESCRRYVDGLTAIRRRHEHQVGGRITILRSSVGRGTYRTKADVGIVFDLTETARSLIPDTGATAKPALGAAGGSYTSIVFVSWKSTRWTVVEQGAP